MDKMVKLQERVYKMEVNNKVLIITDMNQYNEKLEKLKSKFGRCLLYTSPSPRD